MSGGESKETDTQTDVEVEVEKANGRKRWHYLNYLIYLFSTYNLVSLPLLLSLSPSSSGITAVNLATNFEWRLCSIQQAADCSPLLATGQRSARPAYQFHWPLFKAHD